MLIEIYHKDVAPVVGVTTLLNTEIQSVQVAWPTGDESKYNVILSAEATLVLRARGNTITPELFITDYYDEWKVIIYCDSIICFIGFIEPSEGNYPLLDLPMSINIKCTDGLGLLKDIALTAHDGTSFQNQVKTLIEYIAGALAKTELELPIRIICSIYESSMTNRSGSATADMFNQAKLDFRTFQKDPVTFTDCYHALEILLTGGFTLFQWQGKWVISYRPQLMESIGPNDYYTDYNPDATILGSGQDLGTQVNIGKNLQIHPVLADALVTYQVPDVSVKDTYNYNVWPEIPLNNKFERGSLIVLYSGVDYRSYTIDDWDYGAIGLVNTIPFTLAAVGERAYTKRTFDSFNIETERLIICEKPLDGAVSWLRSQPIPVVVGDKISLSFEKRFDKDVSLGDNAAFIYIISDDNTTFYSYLNDDTNDKHKWVLNSNTDAGISIDWNDGLSSQWRGANVTTIGAPITGTLYYVFSITGDNQFEPPTHANQYYRNINFSIAPFIAGGYQQVKGDYWITSQNQSIKNTIDEEIFISDSSHRIFKGALLRNDGLTLATPTWYRYGITEQRHFKELINLGKYRHYYRRYKKVTGTMRGVKCTSENDSLTFFALSFHKHFKFIDDNEGKLYVLSPPLSIDYTMGQFNAVFIEAFDKNSVNIGAESSGQIASHLAALTNASQPRSPLIAFRFGVLVRLYLTTAEAAVTTASASDGGAGNSPSLSLLSDTVAGIGHHYMMWEVGADVMVGNIFTFHLPWGDVSYTAVSVSSYIDDIQEGDSHTFNYIFE